MVDYYKILGVARDASAKEINTAYKKLALKYHPDKSDNAGDSVAIFQQIQEAIEVLRDPIKKREYDATEPRYEWETVVHSIYDDCDDTWMTWDPYDPEYQEFCAWEEARYMATWEGGGGGGTQQRHEEGDQHDTEEYWRQKCTEPTYERHEDCPPVAEAHVDFQKHSKDSHTSPYPLIDLSDEPQDILSDRGPANGLHELLNDNITFDGDTDNQQSTPQDPYEQLSRYFEYMLPSGRYKLGDLQAEIVGFRMESTQSSFLNLQAQPTCETVSDNRGDSSNCGHLGLWKKKFGADTCDICGRLLLLFIMHCSTCKLKACVGCRYERTESLI